MTQKSILTISRNTPLQEIRTLVLRKAGFHVASVRNDEEALGFLERPNSFSLVLMCHSVPELSRQTIVTRSKKLNSKLPVLMLYNGYDPTTAPVDGSIHNLDSPEAMLEMIRFLTMPKEA
ncbi:MAG TPA: response regulator [Candidatus Angelobacter sp.]|jgi:CheY-like chemotaxis protein